MDFLYPFSFPFCHKKNLLVAHFIVFFKELCYLQWSRIHILLHIYVHILLIIKCVVFKIVLITIGWTRLDFHLTQTLKINVTLVPVFIYLMCQGVYTFKGMLIFWKASNSCCDQELVCIWRGKKLGKNDKPIRKARKNCLKVTDTMLYC